MAYTDGILGTEWQEVAEAMRPHEVNHYLAAGYRLLSVMTIDRTQETEPGTGHYRTYKSLRYILARPPGVEHVERPPRERD